MRMAVVAVHVTAGAIALISGYLSLYAGKGKALHRKAGMVFVCSMLVMLTLGIGLAVGGKWAPVNVSAGLITSYLVVTSLTTLRPSGRSFHIGGMLLAVSVAFADLTFAFDAGRRNGLPAFPFFLFGTLALLGTIGDVRVLWSGSLRGTRRIARHLWRMTCALLIAAMSFFLGQVKFIPMPLRALPVVAVLITLLYWMRSSGESQHPAALNAVRVSPPISSTAISL